MWGPIYGHGVHAYELAQLTADSTEGGAFRGSGCVHARDVWTREMNLLITCMIILRIRNVAGLMWFDSGHSRGQTIADRLSMAQHNT